MKEPMREFLCLERGYDSIYFFKPMKYANKQQCIGSNSGISRKDNIKSILKEFGILLKEPLKYLKNPIWSYIAINVLKDPFLELIIFYKNHGRKYFYLVSRRSIKKVSLKLCSDPDITYEEVLKEWSKVL